MQLKLRAGSAVPFDASGIHRGSKVPTGEEGRHSSKALGHEVEGVVQEVGEGVEGFAPGDRVALEGFAYDGDCAYCRQGHYNHCLSRIWFWGARHGGLSEYSTMHVATISRLPEHFSFEQWALRLPLDDVGVAFRIAADKRSGSIKVHLVQS